MGSISAVGTRSPGWRLVGVEGEAVALLQASGDGVAGERAEMGEDVCEVHDSWPAGVRLIAFLIWARPIRHWAAERVRLCAAAQSAHRPN